MTSPRTRRKSSKHVSDHTPDIFSPEESPPPRGPGGVAPKQDGATRRADRSFV